MAVAQRYVLTFTDGETRTVARRPAAFMHMERLFDGRQVGANHQVLATLWAADTGGRGSEEDFMAWVDTLDGWEPEAVEEPGDDARPPEKAPGSSPD